MSEEVTTTATQTTANTVNNGEETRTFTQDEVDRIVRERLEREKGNTQKKYGDYEELKAKAAKFDEEQTAKMTEIEKANAAAEEARAQVAALEAETKALKLSQLKTSLCAKAGLPAGFESRVMGEDEESITADIETLKALLPKTGTGGAGAPSGNSGGSPTTEARYIEAMKSGNIELAMQLKTQMFNESR